MRIIFVRHAESVANAERRIQGHADYELSDEGRTQAELLHDRFVEEGFMPTHVYSSPLARCAQTARIAAREEPEMWSDLIEHDMGKLSKMSIEMAKERYPGLVWSRPSEPKIGIEQPSARRQRSTKVLQRLLSEHGNGDAVLAVSHGGILQSILAEVLGTERTWGVQVQNTAIFDFTIDLNRWPLKGPEAYADCLDTALWRINRFNDATHLAPG